MLLLCNQALKAIRESLATERETSELAAQVYDKQVQFEHNLAQSLAAPAPAAVLVGESGAEKAVAAGQGTKSGKSWWKVW
jgi:hypothetical protein